MHIETYFDYAAATPVDGEVYDAMRPYFSDVFYNPSSIHSGGAKASEALSASRSRVARVMGVKPHEIIFTSGCTEANNLAISGIMQQFQGAKMLYLAIEHDAVRVVASQYDATAIPVHANGLIDLGELTRLITDDVVLISVMYVNNEVGTVQPLREISKLVSKVRGSRGVSGLPLYLHSDGAQAPMTLPITQSATGVDLMSLSGAKIYGPKGVGCLYVRNGISLKPLLLGGGQEYGVRSGTENLPLIVGFSHALDFASTHYKRESERINGLMSQLIRGLEDLGGTILGGPRTSIVSVLFEGIDNEYVLHQLDAKGYQLASGSACHAKLGDDSRVLTALGVGVEDQKSVLRLTLGRHTTPGAVDGLLRTLKDILAHQ